MQNYGQEKYEGVTQTWDVLQREVLSSQKFIRVAWLSNSAEARGLSKKERNLKMHEGQKSNINFS